MNIKRISDKLEKALTDQMNVEDLQSHVYLSYGIWAQDKGYNGIANFLYRHAQEERNHSIKFMNYILDRGGKPKIEPLPGVGKDPKNLKECFDLVFKHEADNSDKIFKIVDLAFEEKDWATWNFLQWFVREQTEEETLARDLIDKLKITGGDKDNNESIFELDRTLGNAPDKASDPVDTTGYNPS